MKNNFNLQASKMVGDGQFPNVFFVTLGDSTFLMTENFNEAYVTWRALPIVLESTLEDRLYGVVCSNEPDEDGIMQRYDDSSVYRG